jgi:hypothetical protein
MGQERGKGGLKGSGGGRMRLEGDKGAPLWSVLDSAWPHQWVVYSLVVVLIPAS